MRTETKGPKNKYKERKSFAGVNWQQTISRTQPIYSDGSPVYINPISKDLTFEESKITILHLSILSHLAKKYHFFQNSSTLSALLRSESLEYLSEVELRKGAQNWINVSTFCALAAQNQIRFRRVKI